MARTRKIALIMSILIIILGGGYIYMKKFLKDEEIKFNHIVKPMITKLVANKWDIKTIDQFASESLKEKQTSKDFVKSLAYFRSLGDIKDYRGSTEISEQNSATSDTAYERVYVVFSKGPYFIDVYLIKQKQNWKIHGLSAYAINFKKTIASN